MVDRLMGYDSMANAPSLPSMVSGKKKRVHQRLYFCNFVMPME